MPPMKAEDRFTAHLRKIVQEEVKAALALAAAEEAALWRESFGDDARKVPQDRAP